MPKKKKRKKRQGWTTNPDEYPDEHPDTHDITPHSDNPTNFNSHDEIEEPCAHNVTLLKDPFHSIEAPSMTCLLGPIPH